MWDTYNDNQIENMQSSLVAGIGKFTVTQFNPNFISSSDKKMIKVVLSVQDNIGGIADVYDFFNVYAENKKHLGMAHHKFKQFLKSIGKIEIYETKSGYQAIIGSGGVCRIKIENGFPKVDEYIVTDNQPKIPVQNQKISQTPQVPNINDLEKDMNDDIPF